MPTQAALFVLIFRFLVAFWVSQDVYGDGAEDNAASAGGRLLKNRGGFHHSGTRLTL